jgi:uncharacterized protein (TIGR02594 family)
MNSLFQQAPNGDYGVTNDPSADLPIKQFLGNGNYPNQTFSQNWGATDPYQQIVNQNLQPQQPQMPLFDQSQIDSNLLQTAQQIMQNRQARNIPDFGSDPLIIRGNGQPPSASDMVHSMMQNVQPYKVPADSFNNPNPFNSKDFVPLSLSGRPLPAPAQTQVHPNVLASALDSLHTDEGKSIASQLGIDLSKMQKPDSLQMPLNSTQRIGAASNTAYAGGTPYAIASSFLGTNERDGRQVLSGFFQKAGGMNLDPATTPWCAAFANSVLKAGGIQGTGSTMARSFLNWGTPTDKPTQGDVVVLRRGSSQTLGHVGFYAGPGDTKGMVKILGGNQGDKVMLKDYPASDVLGYREPPSAHDLMPQRQQAPGMPVVNPQQFSQPRQNMMQTQASPVGGMIGSVLGSLFS